MNLDDDRAKYMAGTKILIFVASVILGFIIMVLCSSNARAQFTPFQLLETENTFGNFNMAVVIDPVASVKENGLNIGIEFEAQCKPIYIRTSLTNFAALKDGYTDFTLALGANFTTNRFNTVRYYSGIRYGLIKRGNNPLYPTAGFEAGINYAPFNQSIYYGIRAAYDFRGDSEFYDGETWEHSGYVLIGLKFN